MALGGRVGPSLPTNLHCSQQSAKLLWQQESAALPELVIYFKAMKPLFAISVCCVSGSMSGRSGAAYVGAPVTGKAGLWEMGPTPILFLQPQGPSAIPQPHHCWAESPPGQQPESPDALPSGGSSRIRDTRKVRERLSSKGGTGEAGGNATRAPSRGDTRMARHPCLAPGKHM